MKQKQTKNTFLVQSCYCLLLQLYFTKLADGRLKAILISMFVTIVLRSDILFTDIFPFSTFLKSKISQYTA